MRNKTKRSRLSSDHKFFHINKHISLTYNIWFNVPKKLSYQEQEGIRWKCCNGAFSGNKEKKVRKIRRRTLWPFYSKIMLLWQSSKKYFYDLANRLMNMWPYKSTPRMCDEIEEENLLARIDSIEFFRNAARTSINTERRGQHLTFSVQTKNVIHVFTRQYVSDWLTFQSIFLTHLPLFDCVSCLFTEVTLHVRRREKRCQLTYFSHKKKSSTSFLCKEQETYKEAAKNVNLHTTWGSLKMSKNIFPSSST